MVKIWWKRHCKPSKLAGIGHALPRATAADVGMGAGRGTFLWGVLHNAKEFSLAKAFFDGRKAHTHTLAHKTALNEDSHAFFGTADSAAIGREAVKRKFQSIALFVFHTYSPSWDGPS